MSKKVFEFKGKKYQPCEWHGCLISEFYSIPTKRGRRGVFSDVPSAVAWLNEQMKQAEDTNDAKTLSRCKKELELIFQELRLPKTESLQSAPRSFSPTLPDFSYREKMPYMMQQKFMMCVDKVIDDQKNQKNLRIRKTDKPKKWHLICLDMKKQENNEAIDIQELDTGDVDIKLPDNDRTEIVRFIESESRKLPTLVLLGKKVTGTKLPSNPMLKKMFGIEEKRNAYFLTKKINEAFMITPPSPVLSRKRSSSSSSLESSYDDSSDNSSDNNKTKSKKRSKQSSVDQYLMKIV